MAFGNARQALEKMSLLDACKLILLTGVYTRPALKPLWNFLLLPWRRKGDVAVSYSVKGRTFTAFIRAQDQESDLHSVMEVVVREAYKLDPAFQPGLVIDGGANLGLFTMQASSVYPSARIVACEPLPRNVTQTAHHLRINQVSADLRPIGIGGAHGGIPFYCRHANASSFDGSTPYDSIMNIDVVPLSELAAGNSNEAVLIKLDIEGMELEELSEYVGKEQGAVVVLGELHQHKRHAHSLQHLLQSHDWDFRLGDTSGDDAVFIARSPQAQALKVFIET